MSTLDVRHPALPKLWALPSIAFARAGRLAVLLIEVFDEAQEEARRAERRYPFMLG